MDNYFHSSFNDVLIRGYLCSPTDAKNLDDAMEVPSIVVQFASNEIHELALRSDVSSMYPTGELVFRSSKVNTISKVMLNQITFLKLELEMSHLEGESRKVDFSNSAYYVVSRIWEDAELEEEFATPTERDRFYHICFDSVRKLNFHGSCVYSSYKDESEGDTIPVIIKKIFKDVGVELKTDYASDKTKLEYITSNNATARSAFMYLARRMFDAYKTDKVDFPFLSYDAFGGNYQLVSLDGLKQREKDKADEMSGIQYAESWTFQVVNSNENAADNEDTDKTTFSVEPGGSNLNDVIKSTFDRARVDYKNDCDSFVNGKKVEMDHLVKKLLVMNPPRDEKIGSNFKMVPVKQFLDVVDKDFKKNKGVFAPTFTATTFRDNMFAMEYLKNLVFGGDRVVLDSPGSMVRTIGDVAYLRTDNDPNNEFNINKFQGEYIIVGIVNRFFRRGADMLYHDGVELAMSSTTQSDIEVA